jgi:hypothetical protein
VVTYKAHCIIGTKLVCQIIDGLLIPFVEFFIGRIGLALSPIMAFLNQTPALDRKHCQAFPNAAVTLPLSAVDNRKGGRQKQTCTSRGPQAILRAAPSVLGANCESGYCRCYGQT